MRKINGVLDATRTDEQWVSFNPYDILGTEPKPFAAKDLVVNEVLIDSVGTFVKIVSLGGSGLFGPDSYSWMWINMKIVDNAHKNPGRFHFDLTTHNPAEKYGGVGFGGWHNSVEEAIAAFPPSFRKKSCGPMYWNKTSDIVRIKRTDLETGEVKTIRPTKKLTALLQSL